MDISQINQIKDIKTLSGLFTAVIRNDNQHELHLENDYLKLVGIPTELSPQEHFKQWFMRVREEDRSMLRNAMRGLTAGIQAELQYLWQHDSLGWINITSTCIVTDKSSEQVTIKGFYKGLPCGTDSSNKKEILLLSNMLTDAMMDGFDFCALADPKTDRIVILRDCLLPEEIYSELTYSGWRDEMKMLIFPDDLNEFSFVTNPETIDNIFRKRNNEITLESRFINHSHQKLRQMKQRYIKLQDPIAGRYGEIIIFNEIKPDNGELFRETMRRRMIEWLALPYRELDLVNLKTGRAYSSKRKLGGFSEAFNEPSIFDDSVMEYVNQCECTKEEYQAILDKFLVKNMISHFCAGERLLETEVRHKTAPDGAAEWVRITAFQSSEDEENNPEMAIVTIMPINAEKEQELQQKRLLENALRSERQYKLAIMSTALAAYSFNVTTDTLFEEVIETENTKPLLGLMNMQAPCSYNQYIENKSRYITSEKEAEHFRRLFNTQTLLDMFNSKRFSFDYEYEFAIDGKKGIFREAVILTKDFETGEVWGLTYVRIITKEREEEKRIQQALRDAFDQAQRANSSKTRFMNQMSHDIRTPLNSILGMASIAREHIDDTNRLLDCMDKIDYAGRHLLEIINNVLDLSAIESGKTVLAQEEFELTPFIGETVKMIQPLADKKGHHLSVSIAKMHEFVCGDRTKLRQLLINVLGNSVKYTPDGGEITFTAVELEPERHDVCRYMFTISDNGIGMSKEYISQVFDPFSRADNNRVSSIQGTGLGMAIAQNIARMMNGEIKVISEEGVGSVFEITVCLRRSEEHAPQYIGEISLEEPKKVRMSDYDFSGRRVLLAEDLMFNAEIAAEFLNQAHIEVEIACNGAEAVRMFREAPVGYYDLIFMDIQMPELDGYEAAKQIRALDKEKAASIPIIAMTANAFIDDIKAANECGMNGHISKPLEIPRLAHELVRFFGDCKKQ